MLNRIQTICKIVMKGKLARASASGLLTDADHGGCTPCCWPALRTGGTHCPRSRPAARQADPCLLSLRALAWMMGMMIKTGKSFMALE